MLHPSIRARRHITRRAVIAWGVAGLDLAVFLGTLWWWAAQGEVAPFDIVLFVAMPIALRGVGAFLTVRVPRNPIGPLLLVATSGFAVLVGAQVAVPILVDLGVASTLVAIVGLSPGLVFIPSILVVLIGIPLIFPSGRMLSPRWWWVVIATVIILIPVELRQLVAPLDVADSLELANPFEDPALAAALEPLYSLSAVAAIPLLLATAASLVIRYRGSDDIGRHQIRWFAAATSVAVLAFSVSFNAPPGVREVAEDVGLTALVVTPIAIGIAVVRYRLYDIDRIISRGISYAVISVVLLAAYVVLVIVLQGPLGGLLGEDTPLTVAVSTLVVASLFQPVRRRIQAVVDHRFDRARVDADRTAGAFAARLRDEVDIDTLRGDLASTVEGAVRPSRLGLWLRDAGP